MKRGVFLSNIKFGETLKELRLKKNFSQTKLAEGICDRTLLIKLEKNETKCPSLTTVMLLCNRLGVTLDEFMNLALNNHYKLDYSKLVFYYLNNDLEDLKTYLKQFDVELLSEKDSRIFKFLSIKLESNYLNESLLYNDLLTNNYKSNYLIDSIDAIAYLNLFGLDEGKELLTKYIDNNIDDKTTLLLINEMLMMSKYDINYYNKLLEYELDLIKKHDEYKLLHHYFINKHKEESEKNNISKKL